MNHGAFPWGEFHFIAAQLRRHSWAHAGCASWDDDSPAGDARRAPGLSSTPESIAAQRDAETTKLEQEYVVVRKIKFALWNGIKRKKIPDTSGGTVVIRGDDPNLIAGRQGCCQVEDSESLKTVFQHPVYERIWAAENNATLTALFQERESRLYEAKRRCDVSAETESVPKTLRELFQKDKAQYYGLGILSPSSILSLPHQHTTG